LNPQELIGADLVVLPGSKYVAADLDWLVARGFAPALGKRASAGAPILGICGGLQMLGREMVDSAGVDGTRAGLGLLATSTTFAAAKATRVTETAFADELPAPWCGLAGMNVQGYEIRHGETEIVGPTAEALPDGLGFISGSVLGVYLHGIFEQPALSRVLVGSATTTTLEATFERLADVVDSVLDRELLDRLAGLA
jgi:adenosylcobyric acid synthase